jgi:hypothetical protein
MHAFLYSFIKEGNVPLWNPYSQSGTPFFANMANTLYYLPDQIHAIVDIAYAYPIHYGFHMFLAMIGMYWLLRKKLSHLPSWFGGLVYGLNGYFMASIWNGHPAKIANAAWFPIVLYFYLEVIYEKKVRSLLFASGAFALMYLSGYPVVVLISTIVLGIFSIVQSIFSKSIRTILMLSVIIFSGLAIGSVQFFPNREFLALSVRSFSIPYAWSAIGSLEWKQLLEFIEPHLFADHYTYVSAWQYYTERIAFFGRIPLVLCLLTLFMYVKHKSMRKQQTLLLISFIAMLFGIWVSLGSNAAPFDLNALLFSLVSFYRSIRIPTRHIILVPFAGAILAAYGLKFIQKFSVRALLIVFTTAELLWFGWHFITPTSRPESVQDPFLLNLLSKSSATDALFRFLPNYNMAERPHLALEFQTAAFYRYFSATGYDPQMVKSFYEFSDAVNGVSDPSIVSIDNQPPYLDNYSNWIDFYILIIFLNLRS